MDATDASRRSPQPDHPTGDGLAAGLARVLVHSLLLCVAGLLTAAPTLVSGCLPSQPPPPPAAIPYRPDPSIGNLFQPRIPSPPLITEPPAQPPVRDFSWTPAAPLHGWKYIVLHHTASTSGSVDSIDETHQQRTDSSGNPWRGIGYHFVIGNGNGMPDGAIEPTFRWQEQSSGAHAGINEYNRLGIGICLVGNFEESPPSPAQVAAVKRLVAALKAQCGLETDQILRHGDLKATECPGQFFPFADVAATPPELSSAHTFPQR